MGYGYRGADPVHLDFFEAPSVPDKGSTPAILLKSGSILIDAPDEGAPTGIRDRTLLAAFAFIAVLFEEPRQLKVEKIVRDGEHTVIRIKGKGNELRRGEIPLVAAAAPEKADISKDRRGPNFRPGISPRGLGLVVFIGNQLTVRVFKNLRIKTDWKSQKMNR